VLEDGEEMLFLPLGNLRYTARETLPRNEQTPREVLPMPVLPLVAPHKHDDPGKKQNLSLYEKKERTKW